MQVSKPHNSRTTRTVQWRADITTWKELEPKALEPGPGSGHGHPAHMGRTLTSFILSGPYIFFF